MAALTTSTAWPAAPDPRAIRFGRETSASGPADARVADKAPWSFEWQLKRNCSMAPRQLLGFYLSLCVISLGIAGVLWVQGAVMVMPFAGLELLVVGLLMLLYARHAADSESIWLRGDEFTVEHACGSRIERVSFQPAWVRVEPEHGDRSLIELSGQGRRIAVGRFVRPEQRSQLAEEFRWALRRWQQRAGRVAL